MILWSQRTISKKNQESGWGGPPGRRCLSRPGEGEEVSFVEVLGTVVWGRGDSKHHSPVRGCLRPECLEQGAGDVGQRGTMATSKNLAFYWEGKSTAELGAEA